jgi:glutathionylspermidine synthase
LLEAGAIQWFWLQDVNRRADQFNSIHEQLLQTWAKFYENYNQPLYFTSVENHEEDFGNVRYLQDTAEQAGLRTVYVALEKIAFDLDSQQFLDPSGSPIGTLFKLYPWEWMLQEEFGRHLPVAPTRWIEPPWKMLLSNKSLLVVMWELFPDSPYLLPAAYTPMGSSYVCKPCLSREGSNVSIFHGGTQIDGTSGPYVTGPRVYQEYHELPVFSGNYPVIGSWIVGGEACGLGVREDRSRITHNMSRFVPHLFF